MARPTTSKKTSLSSSSRLQQPYRPQNKALFYSTYQFGSLTIVILRTFRSKLTMESSRRTAIQHASQLRARSGWHPGRQSKSLSGTCWTDASLTVRSQLSVQASETPSSRSSKLATKWQLKTVTETQFNWQTRLSSTRPNTVLMSSARTAS